MLKVSVIIPSYNSFKTVFRTLDSILGLNSSPQIQEIIVVDCSDDGRTRPMLSSYISSKVRIVELSEKTPPADGRNIGAKMAVGNLLCFIDSDVYLDEFWLDHVIQAYESGCRIGGGSVGIPYSQRKNHIALAQLYLQFNESLKTGKTRKIAMLPACNMFVERRLFEDIGGFPRLRASEDVLFCLKCAAYAPVWFVPAAQCFHIFREEKKPYFQNQVVLGKYIMVYRRMLYKKWYYRKPWVSLLLPLFMLIKTLRISLRIMKAGQEHLVNFILSFPLFAAGLFYWAKGFYEESMQEPKPC